MFESKTQSARRGALLALFSSAALAAGCGSSSSTITPPAASPRLPSITQATFSNPSAITHPLLAFDAGTALTYATEDAEDVETIVVERLAVTRMVFGVECAVVRDRVFADGLLLEDTHDWYAQDDAGNVWYMGEEVVNYEYDEDGNLLGTNDEGSWEAGLDVAGVGVLAQPGIAMWESPAVGDYYFKEYYPGVAEDTARVRSTAELVTLADGSEHVCFHIEDGTTLDPSEREAKHYAPGLGFIREEKPGEPGTLELRGRFDANASSIPVFSLSALSTPAQLTHAHFSEPANIARIYVGEEDGEFETIVVERLPGTRTVMGLDCAIVQDRVFQDDLLVEDTHDWFAQDDDGNVWYMGEEVVNYEYDEDGNLLGTNSGGSWEAGLDVAGAGATALPGYQLQAQPTIGASYYQEWYPTEAEDMGLVVATDATVELAAGFELTGCIQVLDWNPLEPDGLEYKFYAPGLGFVREEALHEEFDAELVAFYDRSSSSLANFAAASFTQSTLVDHPHFPLPTGASWSYEAETEDGVETILVEVLPQTRVVAGVTCLVVRDRVYLEGVLIEDTHDWFAQDDAGSVWYLGEEVVNYEYDEYGVLVGTNNEGSWEAGLDVAGVGHVALPGLQMPANPVEAASYYQEYYETEAEDMGQIIETDATVELPSGTVYTGCVITADWNPFEPASVEYKAFAPGIGFVFERKLNETEELELVSASF